MELEYEKAVELIKNAEEIRTWISFNEDSGGSVRVNKMDVLKLLGVRHREEIERNGIVDTSLYSVDKITSDGGIICIGV